MSSVATVRVIPLFMHVARVALFAAVLVAACTPALVARVVAPFGDAAAYADVVAWLAAAAASAALFFAVFAFFHDCAHGALELPTTD